MTDNSSLPKFNSHKASWLVMLMSIILVGIMSFHMMVRAETEPNDSFDTADPITINVGLSNAEVGARATLTTDDYDYYSFTGNLTLDISTETAQLYDFDSNCLHSVWEMIDPDFDSTFSLSEEQGAMTTFVPFSGNDLFHSIDYNAPRLLQDWSGDFVLETTLRANPTSEYQGAGLLAWQDDDNFLRVEYGFGGLNSNQIKGVHFSKEQNGSYNTITTNIENPVSADEINLRLKREGDMFSAEYSSDGTVWFNAGSTLVPLDATLKLGIATINNGSGLFRASFDGVNVIGDTTFSENFNSNCLAPKWMLTDPNLDSSFSLLANDGSLRLYAPFDGNDLYEPSNNDAPRLMRNWIGDFIVVTKVAVEPRFNYQGAGILAWQDDENFIRLEYGFYGVDGEPYPGILVNAEQMGDFWAVSPNSNHPFSESEVYLRMQRFGDMFTTSYSTNGVQWTTVATTELSLDSTIQVGLATINQWQSNPFYADFDFIEFQDVPNVYLPIVKK